ncbi:MAG: HAMP domain-containing sensor histidine kinase [Patescibacteria group bacterium]|nr:HAMP domain-containing histidine kinase [Patescibacteria group bacterium]
MNLIIKYKKYLLVFLLNLAMFFGLFLCGVHHSDSFFLSFVFLWLVSFVFINFIIFCLFEIIKRERNIFLKGKEDFSFKMTKCLDKMAENYNIVEISKISFGIYHDLANILTVLGLSLEQLKSTCFSQGNKSNNHQRVNYNNLIDVSTKAFSLVSFLKDQYKNKVSFNRFEIAEEIRKNLLLFSFYFKKYKINIKLSLQNNLFLFSNKIKFSQIIINLISNAIDSLKQRGDDFSKKIYIKLCKSNEFIYLIFKDNGVGIDSENLSLIFKPFFSLKNESDNINCGLGLFSCRKIIENDFLGKIKVKSDFGRGAKFIIKIPLSSI